MTPTTEQAQDAAGQAKEKAGEAAEQARGQLRTPVDQRSTQAGEQVSTQAADVRAVADSLREQGKDGPAKLAEQAADHAEKLGSYLTDSDADTILSDLEDLGRKQPMAVVAGGLLLGFAASRFLKATSEKRYEAAQSRPRTQPQAPAPSLPPVATGGVPADDGFGVPATGTTTAPASGTLGGVAV